MAAIEGIHLDRLLSQFDTAICDHEAEPDEAIARLIPDVYPDDPDASAEFAAATRSDLLERRRHEAVIVRTDLEAFIADRSDDEALESLDLTIPAGHLDAWLRTLTSLRLVLAARLEITEADDHDPDDARYAIYDWLGFRLDGLIAIADAVDEDAAPPHGD